MAYGTVNTAGVGEDELETVKASLNDHKNNTSNPHGVTASQIGAASSGHKHSYNDLTDKPTIPAAVTVDAQLSSNSANPVQNKAVNAALNGKASTSHKHSVSDVTDLDKTLAELSPLKSLASRSATIVIASKNGYSKSNTLADYVCDGTDDQTEIKNAIAALPSAGGKIVFMEGTYNISSEFTIDKNVVFEGMGDGTILNVSHTLASGADLVRVVFRDMTINASGILHHLYTGTTNNVMLDNVNLSMIVVDDSASGWEAFYDVGTFKAVNSKLSLKCTDNNVDCYAIAQGDMTAHAVFSDCDITLDGQYGRMHTGRQHTDMNNCNIHIINSVNTSRQGFVGGVGNIMTGGLLDIQNSSKGAVYIYDAMGEGCFIGVTIVLKTPESLSTSGRLSIIGCRMRNLTVSGEAAIANIKI